MDLCDRQYRFISIYFYGNGVPCKPEKIRVRRHEVEEKFEKAGKYFFYRGRAVFTMNGDIVTGFGRIDDNSGFVLAHPNEPFITCNYKEVLDGFLKNKADAGKKSKEELGKKGRSKSAPVDPCKQDRSRSKSSTRKSDKSLNSIAGCSTDQSRHSERSKRSECSKRFEKSTRDEICKLRKKKGFFAKCCPCCSKKPKPTRHKNTCRMTPRPKHYPNNIKMTQTCPQDFKISKNVLNKAIKEEKKRKKMEAKSNKSMDNIRQKEEKDRHKMENSKCKSEVHKCKSEEEYKKAKAKNRAKRKKMEQKVERSLKKKHTS